MLPRCAILVTLCFLDLFGAAGCSGSNGGTSPTQPSNDVPVTILWTGSGSLTNASGGECVGPKLIRNRTWPETIITTQTGSSIELAHIEPALGAAVIYTGNVSGSTISMQATQLQAPFNPPITFYCEDGTMRQVQTKSGTLKVTTDKPGLNDATTIDGSIVETYDVTLPGTTTVLATLTVNQAFSVKKFVY